MIMNMTKLEMQGEAAKKASRLLAVISHEEKNSALLEIAKQIKEGKEQILSANAVDLEKAKASGISSSMADRLALSEKRIEDISNSILDICNLPDPIGSVDEVFTRPNGLEISKVRVPIGVIGIIYEARPNVTADAAVLCFKSGNAVILKGGKEAINSNIAIITVMRKALLNVGLPVDCFQLVTDTSRETANELMKLNKYLDVLIPRGGASLIRAVVENATVPVIQTGVGNCHIYVDESADIEMAANIIFNAKTSRVSVCNACETLLIHKNIAKKALPVIKARLDEKNVELRGCELTREILGSCVKIASENDYEVEFLDYIIAVKVVDSLDDAIAHIAKYSSGHSECIVTKEHAAAEKFTHWVDSAVVYVNASTRFTDGGEFGFGAEIGISTQKLHARGPMGLRELTSIKYIVNGNGQIR